jgi:hypothetical protein
MPKLGKLAGLDVSNYFSRLRGLKNSNLITEDEQGLRVNHAALQDYRRSPS